MHLTRPPRINERSESFNEQQLAHHLAQENAARVAFGCAVQPRDDHQYNCRRESFNESCLRGYGDEARERRRSQQNESPFVSMPTIPAVYMAEDGENQPLEKVNLVNIRFCGVSREMQFSLWFKQFNMYIYYYSGKCQTIFFLHKEESYVKN